MCDFHFFCLPSASAPFGVPAVKLNSLQSFLTFFNVSAAE